MLKSRGKVVEILTRRIGGNEVGGIGARRGENGRLCGNFCRVLVVNGLTRHAASLHANGDFLNL